MSRFAAKWRTFHSLVARGDWSGVRERVLTNGLRAFGAFDASKPKHFARWQARHPARDASALLAALPDDMPLVSVLTPVYDVAAPYLEACIASVKAQIYPRWQLVLVNDGSSASHIRPLLDAIADERITVVHCALNGGISAASQIALEHARGEWIALLDNDDEITPDALAEMVLSLSGGCEWIYSDFVLKQPNGELASPYFKPDFSPERLNRQMYLNHLQMMKRDAVLAVGGFRSGFDGSQDFDLALRMMERGTPVVHVPKVLYHWRVVPGSTAERYEAKPYANDAAKRALRSALVRRGLAEPQDGGDGRHACDVQVSDGRAPGTFRVEMKVGRLARGEERVVAAQPLVSILIPFRDAWKVTERCLQSIVMRSSYRHVELVLIDNGSVSPETHAGVDAFCRAHPRAQCIRDPRPFNHSALNNLGAERSSGEVLVLLNNDTEVESADWIEQMLSHAQHPRIGAVGCLLLYPNRTIQHAGIVLGLRGVAGHPFARASETHPGYFGSVAAEQNVSAVTGACLMVRKALYQAIGGLDANVFPTSFNDVDFCLRLRERGYRNVYTGQCKLLHYESYTRRKDAGDEAARRAMQMRWGPSLLRDPYYSPNFNPGAEAYRFD